MFSQRRKLHIEYSKQLFAVFMLHVADIYLLLSLCTYVLEISCYALLYMLKSYQNKINVNWDDMFCTNIFLYWTSRTRDITLYFVNTKAFYTSLRKWMKMLPNRTHMIIGMRCCARVFSVSISDQLYQSHELHSMGIMVSVERRIFLNFYLYISKIETK